MTALPRIVARPGIPEAPGRARLHVVPRPDGRDRQADGFGARYCRPAPEEGSSPSPSPSSDLAAFGALCLVVGALLGWGLRTQDVNTERAARIEAQETAEVLSANSDYLACEYVRAAQVVRRVPGFGAFVRTADVLGEQLAPEVRAACKGAR